MTEQEKQTIEKFFNKPISEIDEIDIPAYIRKRDKEKGDGEFDPETKKELMKALQEDKEAGLIEDIAETTGEMIEDMGLEEEVEQFSEEYPLGGSLEPYDIVEEH